MIRSVANLTRADGQEFLELAPRVPVKTAVQTFGFSRPTRPWTGCAGAGSRERRCWWWTSERILRERLGEFFVGGPPTPM